MAATDANFLLRALQPPVQPEYLKGPAARPQPPVEGRSFADLLHQAGSGAIASGRAVTQDPVAGAPLEPGQLERIAVAADQAEAAGARRALVMIDGRGLLLDVADRRLTEELSASNRMMAVDTALTVPAEDEGEERPIGPPSALPPRGAADEIARTRVGQIPAN